MLKRVVLFRFHKCPTVCRNRIRLLRLFNPDVAIYGLYGGEGNRRSVQRQLGPVVEHVFHLAGKDAEWKWKHGDLAVRMWYREIGRDLSFDVLHLIEWDMLVLAPLEMAYGHVPRGSLGLSGLEPLEGGGTWKWTGREPFRGEWQKLLGHVRKHFGDPAEHYRSIATGVCIPRDFIEKYSAADVPELCNDEVRLPLFARALGFGLFDNGHYDRRSAEAKRFFSLGRTCVSDRLIVRELARKNGRRVFHPYRKELCRLVECSRWYNAWYAVRQAGKKVARMAK